MGVDIGGGGFIEPGWAQVLPGSVSRAAVLCGEPYLSPQQKLASYYISIHTMSTTTTSYFPRVCLLRIEAALTVTGRCVGMTEHHSS